MIKVNLLSRPLFLFDVIVQVDALRLDLAGLSSAVVALVGVVQLTNFVVVGLLLLAVPVLLQPVFHGSSPEMLNVAVAFFSLFGVELLVVVGRHNLVIRFAILRGFLDFDK
jgi:hypothetical protein